MKLLLDVHPALNLAAGNGLNDLGYPSQKIILLLFALNAVVQQLTNTRKALSQCKVCALGDFVTHQDADLIELLPLAIQSQQGTDFKITSGNVKFMRNF